MHPPYIPCLVLGIASVLGGALHAQNTVGLVSFDPVVPQDGYMLIFPDNQGSTFLLDMCGQLVHQWPDTIYYPGNGVRFMDDGSISRCAVHTENGAGSFLAGGYGEYLERRDWENNVTWLYRCSSETECMHHDVEVLPNGNVLLIVWELKSRVEAWEAGRDTSEFFAPGVWPDKVIEVQPTGPETGTIVWEWHAWDHLVQNIDPTRFNYGEPSENPGLIDINYDGSGGVADWLHTNGIDYNPELDQIMLSVPYFNELWVIDHSTTTAEAAQHTGGASGRGGDLLYRWGNPRAYGRGGGVAQRLFFNHCTTWIGPGLAENDPDRGKIMVFNNRVGGDHSSADILTPPLLPNGLYELPEEDAYGPTNAEQRFMTADPEDMFSPGQGSAQKLPNGNVLVCSARQGWMLQLNAAGEVKWEYVNPLDSGEPVAQGTVLEDRGIVFQAAWLPPDHPGLQGRDLTPIGYIELDPNVGFCTIITDVAAASATPAGVSILNTLAEDRITVRSDVATNYTITDASGRCMHTGRLVQGDNVVLLPGMAQGMYLLRAANGTGQRFQLH